MKCSRKLAGLWSPQEVTKHHIVLWHICVIAACSKGFCLLFSYVGFAKGGLSISGNNSSLGHFFFVKRQQIKTLLPGPCIDRFPSEAICDPSLSSWQCSSKGWVHKWVYKETCSISCSKWFLQLQDTEPLLSRPCAWLLPTVVFCDSYCTGFLVKKKFFKGTAYIYIQKELRELRVKRGRIHSVGVACWHSRKTQVLIPAQMSTEHVSCGEFCNPYVPSFLIWRREC